MLQKGTSLPCNSQPLQQHKLYDYILIIIISIMTIIITSKYNIDNTKIIIIFY